MRRFFIEQANENRATLCGDDAKHIFRVLRLAEGDSLALCDGDGTEYDARIVSASAEEIVCVLENPHASDAEVPCRVTLFQCLPKAAKMETIVQKCTELGVFAVAPVVSRRCVVVPDRDYDKKRCRCARVAFEAAKQARRACVPEILPLTAIQGLPIKAFDLFLIAFEEEEGRTLKSALRAAAAEKELRSVALLIGPEGGFDASELSNLIEQGAICVSLGKRILRTETAGMAALAQIVYEVEP